MIDGEELARSPAWFPLEFAAADAVRLIRLSEATYRSASFLDRRALASNPQQAIGDLGMLEAAATQLAPRAHYIFHIGHVGSTLISRLVGEHEQVFSLREPALLRGIAAQAGGSAGSEGALARALPLGTLLRLLARTWRPEQRAVIKATSFVSELAPLMLASSEQPATILVFAQPLAYLRGILGGSGSRVEAQMLAPSRAQRLARRLGPGEWRAQLRTEGEHLAMSWLCEMAALRQAHEAGLPARARSLWVDFDQFLADPARMLLQIFGTLGASPALHECEALVHGPLMRRYSKAPEYAYDAELRREVLAAAERQHGAEIGRGMRWLERLAGHCTLVARILETR